MLCCLSSLAYRTLWFFRGDQAAPWQRLELAGALALNYTSAIPFAILHFSGHIYFRVIYLSCLSMVAVEKMTQVLTRDQINLDRDRVFRYHCVSMGLLALVPAVHGLCQIAPYKSGVGRIRWNRISTDGWRIFERLLHLLQTWMRWVEFWKISTPFCRNQGGD